MASAQDDDDRTEIYTVDLESGETTLFGTVDSDSDGMAVADDGTIYLLSDDDNLLTFTQVASSDATPRRPVPIR